METQGHARSSHKTDPTEKRAKSRRIFLPGNVSTPNSSRGLLFESVFSTMNVMPLGSNKTQTAVRF
jgi:hypothetical protein